MKLLVFLIQVYLAFLCTETEGALRCWTCIGVRNTFECLRKGRMQTCLYNQNACQTETRRGSNGIQITKRCSQEHSCNNNQIQNARAAWLPSQCNPYAPSSVCRCCCFYDGCNRDMLTCSSKPSCQPFQAPLFGRKYCRFSKRLHEVGTLCRFRCNKGFKRIGSRFTTCVWDSKIKQGFYNRKTPRCVPKPPPTCRRQRAPTHGTVSCSNGMKVGSVCKYACDDFHLLTGQDAIKCDRKGKWNGIPPACVHVSCSVLPSPVNGNISCTYGNAEDSICTFSCVKGYEVVGKRFSMCLHTRDSGVWSEKVPKCKRQKCDGLPPAINNGNYTCTDGRFFNSECVISCNSNHKVIGNSRILCTTNKRGKTTWNKKFPTCQEITCDGQDTLRNGRVVCTNENKVNSVCSFECTTKDFNLASVESSNICLNNSKWSFPTPCCARVCPPFAIIDLVIMIDSSSSIGDENWRTIKNFIKELIGTFEIGRRGARIGIFRYNSVIDERSEILLKDFPDDKESLLLAFDEIPYDGSGTYTGKGLRHARYAQFSRRNGNRPGVPDYLLVITDGTSVDSVEVVSKGLHDDGVRVLAVGVVPSRGRLNLKQLAGIVSKEENLVIATSGFGDLNINLFHNLVQTLCIPGCS